MTLLARNLQRSHEELASYVTPEVSATLDLSTLDRFQQYGAAGLTVVNAEVTRQAAMIAYLNDFYLMMWLSLAAVPLVLLMRRSPSYRR